MQKDHPLAVPLAEPEKHGSAPPTEGRPAGSGRSEKAKRKWQLRKVYTRRMLIRAGRELFADPGFTAPRVEDIASAVGISRAAFYLYFKSLEELVQAVFIREVTWQLRWHRALDATILADEALTLAWLEQVIANFRKERHYILINYRALSTNPELMSVTFEENSRLIARWARRLPTLRLLGPDGEIDPLRSVRLYSILRRIEDMALFAAFNAWNRHLELSLRLLAEDLVAFARPMQVD
ncbi:MAG: helix-turn-helix domain-containing protein [Sphingobium sp.]